MISVFPKSEEFYARRTKKRLLILFFVLLAIYLCAEIFMITFYIIRVNDFQDRSLQTLFTCLSIALSAAFGFFCIVFFTIKYKRTKMYVKMFDDIRTGERAEEIGTLTGYEQSVREKDFVPFYVMKLSMPARSRMAKNVDREVLVYAEAPHPTDAIGSKIKILTHSNILIAFEVVQENHDEQN